MGKKKNQSADGTDVKEDAPNAEKAHAPKSHPHVGSAMQGKFRVMADFAGSVGHLTRHSVGSVTLTKGQIVDGTHQPVAAWVKQGLKVEPVK